MPLKQPFLRQQVAELGEQCFHQVTFQMAGSSSDHNLLLQKRQPLTALAEEVCANHRQLSEALPLSLARADSSGDSWVSCSLLQSDAPASSLQQSCCYPCIPLYHAISPLAYLHGYFCCHSELDTNFIPQHLIIISS